MPGLGVAFAILAIMAFAGSILILGYLVRTERSAPKFANSLQSLTATRSSDVLVSIIVPARNEDRVISNCVESLIVQSHKNLEIIVVDDSSSDNTRIVVNSLARRDDRVKLVLAGPKPEGWVGKSWPCWKGYGHSKGTYLLFVDADSTLGPSTVESSLRYALEKGIDMLSLSPRLEMAGLTARAVLPIVSGAINLLYPMQKVNEKRNKRAYVFGTFMLVKKLVYESIRGHERVKGELVEDAAIAKVTKAEGYVLRIERGPEFVSTKWATDSISIYQGLERIISSSVRSYGLVSIVNAVLLFFMTIYPILYLIFFALLLPTGYDVFVGLIASALCIVAFLFLAEFETVTISGKAGVEGFLYPLGSILFISAITSASVKVSGRKEILWKNAGYVQAPNSRT